MGMIDSIAPLDAKKLRSVISEHIGVEKELVEAVIAMKDSQRETVSDFFKTLT
jgi:hypothetical protein